MANIISYVMSHYKDVVLALLAIDVALMPIFPNAGLLGKLKDILSGLAPKQ